MKKSLLLTISILIFITAMLGAQVAYIAKAHAAGTQFVTNGSSSIGTFPSNLDFNSFRINTSSVNSASVTSISENFVGSDNTTLSDTSGWTTHINASVDDSFVQIPLGFNTSFNGSTYSSAFISSNTYITFGSGSGNYSGLSASNPAIPGVHMCAADNSYQKVFSKLDSSGVYRVRYEGNAGTSGTVGFPGIIYEAVFYQNQSYFDVHIGIQNRCTEDFVAPTITSVNSSTANGTYKVGDNINVTVNFSEPVTSVGNITATLETGDVDRTCTFTVTSATSGSCTYTVQAGDYSTDLNATISGSIRDIGNNFMSNFTPGTSLAANKNIAVDGRPPAVASVNSSTPNGSYRQGEVIPILVNFGEIVTMTGSGTPTLTLSTGSPATTEIEYVSGSGTSTYTFEYTVEASNYSSDLDYASVSALDLDGNTLTDDADNTSTSLTLPSPGASGSLGANRNIIIDNTKPDVTISSGSPQPTNTSPIPVTISFTESVTGLALSDFITTNATPTSLLGSGSSYTLSLVPSDQGAVDISLPADSVVDAAGNNNAVSNTLSRSYDSVQPTAALTTTSSDPTNESPIEVTATFSEYINNFDLNDVTVVNGTPSNFENVNGFIYTFEVTPTSQGDVEISLASGSGQDSADNDTQASNILEIEYDTVAPDIESISIDDTQLSIGDTATLTVVFTEPVSSFTTSNITSISSGTVFAFSTNDGGITWATTFTPDVDIEDSSNIITISKVGVEDQAGNSGSGSSDSSNYQVDTLRPTITSITSSVNDGRYSEGDVIDLIINFSENVTSNGDVEVILGTVPTNQSCTINVTNSDEATCDYVVQSGDAATHLDVLSVDGDIEDMFGNSMEVYEPIQNLAANKSIEVDNDGIESSVEADAPNGGDGNGDGILDWEQPNVASFYDDLSEGYVTIVGPEGSNFSNARWIEEETQDGSYKYPFGLIEFVLNGIEEGSVADFTLFIESDAEPTSYEIKKYFESNQTYENLEGAQISSLFIEQTQFLKVAYSIRDGSKYDIDGEVNGSIADPIGLALKPQILPRTGITLLSSLFTANVLVIFGAALLLLRRKENGDLVVDAGWSAK